MQTCYHLHSLLMNITLHTTQESTMLCMCRARAMGNTCDFKGIISSTYTTWILVKQTGSDCYFNTAKKGKALSSILDQKRAESVKTLQESCAFPSNEGFTNALELQLH